MRGSKGFTLVELLAVLVILAIIALITTPIILGVINDSRESAARDKTWAYIDAIENAFALDQTSNNPAGLPLNGTLTDGAGKVGSEDIRVSGAKAEESGSFKIDKEGTVTVSGLKFDGFTCGNPMQNIDGEPKPNPNEVTCNPN